MTTEPTKPESGGRNRAESVLTNINPSESQDFSPEAAKERLNKAKYLFYSSRHKTKTPKSIQKPTYC